MALRLPIFYSAAMYLFALATVFIFADAALAHEHWILTPEQIVEWNSKPKPELFTQWSARNVTIITVFFIFVFGWVRFGYTGARELFPDLQARLSSYGDYVSRFYAFA